MVPLKFVVAAILTYVGRKDSTLFQRSNLSHVKLKTNSKNVTVCIKALKFKNTRRTKKKKKNEKRKNKSHHCHSIMDLASSSSPNPQQKSFCFPILKNSVILQCMTELGYELNEKELLEPHKYKDRVKSIFRELVKLLLGLSEEDLSIPPKAFLEAQETKPYPDLHDESAIEVFFFQSVIQLMTICGIHDFGLRDLIAPNAKRLKRQLSGAINFCKFYEERTNMYGELTAQRNELLDGLGEVEAENELLQQQKQESQIVAMDRSKEIEEVENECLEIEKEISEQNKLQASIRTETGNLKKEANTLKGKAATALLSLQEAKSEERVLSAQVVQSPKRIKREMEQAVKFMEMETQGCDVIEREVQSGEQKLKYVKDSIHDIQKSVSIMEGELHEKIDEYNSISTRLQEVMKKKSENEKTEKDLINKKRDLERKIRHNEERLSHQRQQGKRRLVTTQQELDFVQTELRLVEKDRMDGLARVETAESDVRAIETKIEEERLQIQKEIQDMISVYKKFENVIMEKEMNLMTAALTI